MSVITMEERPGMLARLADLLFGSVLVADGTPSTAVAVKLVDAAGSRRVETVWSESGRPVYEQVDELLGRLHRSIPEEGLRIQDIGFGGRDEERRWVVACRATTARGDIAQVAVIATSAEEAALRARFAIASQGRPVELDDIGALHDLGESIAAIEAMDVREEPASYDDFRKLVAGLARDLRQGTPVDATALPEIERILTQFASSPRRPEGV